MLAVEAEAFWTAKGGNRQSEWEDHFSFDEATGRFAVADGASSSPKAAAWAATLTEGFLDDPFDLCDTASLASWIDRRCAMFQELGASDEPEEVTAANWMEAAVATKHGFATFVGAIFDASPGQSARCRWVGVGDSCLFHMRSDELLLAAPTSNPDDFGTHPALISSNPEHRPQAVTAAFRGEAEVHDGDVVLLVSDALAEWALAVAPKVPGVWKVLDRIDHDTFQRLVRDLRDAERIVNDDVTLVRCRVSS